MRDVLRPRHHSNCAIQWPLTTKLGLSWDGLTRIARLDFDRVGCGLAASKEAVEYVLHGV